MYVVVVVVVVVVQGITLKVVGNKLVIARILYGGLIYRQGLRTIVFFPGYFTPLPSSGLLQVGDRILEVNNEPVDNMTPSELQSLLVSMSSFYYLRYYGSILSIETQFWLHCDQS